MTAIGLGTLSPTIRGFTSWIPINDHVVDVAGKIFTQISQGVAQCTRIIQTVRLGKVGLIPFYLYSAASGVYFLVKDKTKGRTRVFLEIIDNLRYTIECAPALVAFCERFKVPFIITASQLALPFGIVDSILSIVSIFKESREIHLIKALQKELDGVQGETKLDKLHNIRVLFDKHQKEDSTFSREVFKLDEKRLNDALDCIEQNVRAKIVSGDLNKCQESERIIDCTIEKIKLRIRDSKINSALKLTASLVNFIGAVLLIVCPPFLIGTVFIAASSCLVGVYLVHAKITDCKFIDSIGVSRNWYDISWC